MDNSQVLKLLAPLISHEVLEVLAFNPATWHVLREEAKKQYFWYERTKNLFHSDLKQRLNEDWKSAYYVLKDVVNLDYKFTSDVLKNALATSILLEIGGRSYSWHT